MNIIYPCYCCHDPIPESQKRIAAFFYGQNRDVCEDCGEGIYYGNETLARLGVKGEALKTPERKTTL